MKQLLISVILPVYNRIEHLGKAVDSVLAQTYKNWELIIADDASHEETRNFLEKYSDLDNIKIYSNTENLGLFANLNLAITRSRGAYIMLLCSDDFLLPQCLETSMERIQAFPEVGLFLSAFNVVDLNDQEIPSLSIFRYEHYLSAPVQLMKPNETLPLLLKHGSINGNITGMLFTKNIYNQVGQFKEDLVQVGDWEWLYRVVRSNCIVMSTDPIATVRLHERQLSALNFKEASNSLECIEMLNILLKDETIAKLDYASSRVLYTMQFHLWYALKFLLKGNIKEALIIIQAIHNFTGIRNTFLAMIKWLPKRLHVYINKYSSHYLND
jgi:glycosyltransferase involved in cell wall biosynthesis